MYIIYFVYQFIAILNFSATVPVKTQRAQSCYYLILRIQEEDQVWDRKTMSSVLDTVSMRHLSADVQFIVKYASLKWRQVLV